ncbi:MAG: PAS domain-containing protein [Allorhizobium sp.]
MVSAFRLYGFWRINLDTSHFYGTRDIFTIFGMEYCDGPMNLVELVARIHPDDLPMLMETFERTSTEKQTYHTIYRALSGDGSYKFVRTVGKFRDKPGTAGEIVGVTYEFFERQRTIAFVDSPE